MSPDPEAPDGASKQTFSAEVEGNMVRLPLANGLMLDATHISSDRHGGVRALLTVRQEGALVHLDTVTLTSAKSRSTFLEVAAHKGVTNEAVLALTAAVAQVVAERPGAPGAFPPPTGQVAVSEDVLAALRELAAPVLAAPDPLTLVRDAVRARGYGGDVSPAIIVYLATTSRLLEMSAVAMPVHLLLLGLPSTGKSYTLAIVLSLLPTEAVHVIEASSPRALIYDPAPLAHRVLVFGEADSLPSGEDNPAASAVRALLQNHRLRYSVVVRDSETGQYVLQEIDKPGPTVLITTAIHRLGAQLDSRLFSLEVPEDIARIRAALVRRAEIELHGVQEPDPALVAFQALLQARSPWRVVVPFAPRLATAIGQTLASPRILRDFSRILSMIKAVAVLRHQHRQRDQQGRLVAELEDYAFARDLIAPMYGGTASGASDGVRRAVESVATLCAQPGHEEWVAQADGSPRRVRVVTKREVARALELSDMAAWRHVEAALKAGWLTNLEHRERRPAKLIPGDPLPEHEGLPAAESLRPTRTPVLTLPVDHVNVLTDHTSPPSPPASHPQVGTPSPQNYDGNSASYPVNTPDRTNARGPGESSPAVGGPP